MLETMVRVTHSGKQALDKVMLEMGRLVAESVMPMEREEITGPDYHLQNPRIERHSTSPGGWH
jgi:hypothetical protein